MIRRRLRVAQDRAALAVRALRGEGQWQRGGPPLTEAQAGAASPVFVLSTGRCGTRWLAEVLAESRLVFANHSLQPELVRQGRLAYEHGPDALPHQIEVVRAARDDLVSAALQWDRTYVETNHRLTFLAPAALRAYPGSRFVHLVRHPGDFVRSGMRRQWYEGGVDDIGRIRLADGRWASWSRLEQIAWLWNETQRFVEAFLADVPDDRCLRVRSEDLFAETSVAESVLRFVGATDVGRSRLARLQGRPVNAQRTGAFPVFGDWAPGQVRQLRAQCPLAERYGYHLVGD